MPNKLERIQISGFKSIRELDINLRDLNVLIGANGSGKSNFISIFELLNAIIQNKLQQYSGQHNIDFLLYYGMKTSPTLRIQLFFQRGMYDSIFVPSQSGNFIFGEEAIYFDSGQGLTYRKSFNGHSETKINEFVKATPTIGKYFLDAMSDWKIYHFHDTSRTSPIKTKAYLHENERLKPDASNLAAYLYLLQEKYPQNYQRILRTIRRIAPFFDNFVLRPDPLNEENIRLQWRDVNSSDNIFSPHALSDGTLRFMALATLLLQPDDKLPSLILIDEPELGLHPFAINILVSLLQSASTKTQVIVSTQSVPLINQFAPEDIIVVDRKNKQSTFEHLETEDLQDWMTEYSGYGVGDLWEKNVIGGRPQREAL